MTQPSDLEARVRRLLQKGDAAAAAGTVIRELGPSLLRYVRSALLDEEIAADAFADVAEDLWRGLPEFRWECSLRTWALRIAWHAILSVRSDAWQRRRVPLSRGPASALAEDLRTRTPVVRERRSRVLDGLRSRLTPEEQSLLALRIDQGLSWSEVAEVLSADGEAVQSDALAKRFQRLKERIAEMARAEGLVE